MLYEKLPFDIAERHVLLMDPILASGKTVAAAIEARNSTQHVEPRAERWEVWPGKNVGRRWFWFGLGRVEITEGIRWANC